jgi:hypothetical protein
MSNKWPYKTIDEYTYKMHELLGNHILNEPPLFNSRCDCGLEIPISDIFNEEIELKIIENLAIGNQAYKFKSTIKHIAPKLKKMNYPFHLPIHQSLAAYAIALNYYHNIKICNAKTLAIALIQQNELLSSLIIALTGKFNSNYQNIIRSTWEIEGDLLQEMLNL